MTRQTCRADEVSDDTCIVENGKVREVVKAFTAGDKTTFIDADGESWRCSARATITLATKADAEDYDRGKDRETLAAAFCALARQIVDRQLPVPVGGRGVIVSFDLADDSDLGPWSRWLSTRPQRMTSRPVIQAVAEGVEVQVYGPGTSGEFGPELADAPVGTVGQEFGPMYAAKPPSYDANPTLLYGPGDTRDAALAAYARQLDESNPGWQWDRIDHMDPGLRAEADKRRSAETVPERDGFAPPTGHAAVLPADALQHDGRYDNEGTER